MSQLKVGLLPLYLELYDQTRPEMRQRIEQFLEEVTDLIAHESLTLVQAPICRLESEFTDAIDLFQENDVTAVITLHLAYSPSLESIYQLKRLECPVIILDTTPRFCFDKTTDPEEIIYNHGIHGVQDLCNLMIRQNIEYYVEAGHYKQSDVIKRVYNRCLLAQAARRLKRARVGLIGKPFAGMGDFAVPFSTIKSTIGFGVIEWQEQNYVQYQLEITEADVLAEIERNRSDYQVQVEDLDVHKRAIRDGLVLRKWITDQNLDACSVNFQAINEQSAFKTMPFLEISRSMANGKGYAGEGDVLTAAMCYSLMCLSDYVSFSEMFCPDWKNETVFLSHMGEVNPLIAADKPILKEMDFPYTTALNPVVPYARYRAGQALLISLAPMPEDGFRLVVCRGEIIDVSGEDNMSSSVHGWFKPVLPLTSFLQHYSQAGGTHHLVLIYDVQLNQLEIYGKMSGFDVKII